MSFPEFDNVHVNLGQSEFEHDDGIHVENMNHQGEGFDFGVQVNQASQDNFFQMQNNPEASWGVPQNNNNFAEFAVVVGFFNPRMRWKRIAPRPGNKKRTKGELESSHS